MVKLFCNRCKEEIIGQYFTIDFKEYDTEPEPLEKVTGYVNSGYANSRSGMLALLNSQEMFCTECKAQIENFIYI